MSFQFKMQKVLEYREQLEEEAKIKLANAEHLHILEMRRVNDVKTMLHEQEDKLYRDLNIDYAERWLLDNFVKGLRTDLASAVLRVRSLEQIVQEARRELTERARDRKLLDKLKSRQREHYLQEESLKEQRNYDETATLRYKAPTF